MTMICVVIERDEDDAEREIPPGQRPFHRILERLDVGPPARSPNGNRRPRRPCSARSVSTAAQSRRESLGATAIPIFPIRAGKPVARRAQVRPAQLRHRDIEAGSAESFVFERVGQRLGVDRPAPPGRDAST